MRQSTSEYPARPDAGLGHMPGMPREGSLEMPEENAIGEAQNVQLAGGLPRGVLTFIVNILVIAELFVAMYFAAQNRDEITPVFFKVFFSLLLPTLVISAVAKRLIARRSKR